MTLCVAILSVDDLHTKDNDMSMYYYGNIGIWDSI